MYHNICMCWNPGEVGFYQNALKVRPLCICALLTYKINVSLSLYCCVASTP